MKRIDGVLKDKISTWRARAARNGARARLQVALIAATSHDEGRLQQSEALAAIRRVVLQHEEEDEEVTRAGKVSRRLHAAECARLLLAERLYKTKSWVVALKCLILFHTALVRHGFFDTLLLSDDLDRHDDGSGGLRLHIHIHIHIPPNLIHFKDGSNARSLEASFWIRWYARFLDTLVQACRALGDGTTASFRCYSSPPLRLQQQQLLPSIHILHALLHHICACPLQSASSHLFIRESFKLVALDSLVAQELLRLHIREFLFSRSPSEASEIMHRADRMRPVCDELATDMVSLDRIMQAARSMNLLFSHPDPERAMLTESEVQDFRDAFSGAMSSMALSLRLQ